jgi:catechol 2,3-dioxygenase-like lactoylglutathione lyase family enzyme
VGRRVHHSAVIVSDIEESVRFYRDGLGLEVLMDSEFLGDWPRLFGASSDRLRSVFLGDAADASAGIVELVTFSDGANQAPGRAAPHHGFLLLSLYVDVDATVARLAELGHGEVRRIEVAGPSGPVAMATVRDPDGVLIELVGAA